MKKLPSIISYVPTLNLLRVSPHVVTKAYEDGTFRGADYKFNTPLSHVISGTGKMFKTEDVSSDMDGDVYSTTNKGDTTIMATTNCIQYRSFLKDGKMIPGSECDYCKLEIKGLPVGPVVDVIVADDGIFHMIDAVFDCYSCVFAYIEERMRYAGNADCWYRDVHPRTVEMFSRMYPSAKVVPANDYRLLERNGGCLTEEQWRSTAYRYVEMGIKFAPVKRLYEKKRQLDGW